MRPLPALTREEHDGVAFWTDPHLARLEGITVAFSERAGGVSASPYTSLNLAAHVGDDPVAVDENRTRFLCATGVGELRERLVTAEQVHGAEVARVVEADAGRGAHATGGAAPVAATDGLWTRAPDVPLLLLFADCVPVIIAAPDLRAVAVVHAGWRGALAGIPGRGARELVSAGADPEQLRAYIGPFIGECCYEVDDALVSQFANAFVTVSRVESRHLDLGAAVTESLTGAGVLPSNVCRLDACTAENADRFYSYRAENAVTGRHGALACIHEKGRAHR